MPPNHILEAARRPRIRSVGFLELDGVRWACYLVTYRTGTRTWRGHISFRTSAADEVSTVETATIFVEEDEAAIDRRARTLGRPLMAALLASALEVDAVARSAPDEGYHEWMQAALRDRASACGAPDGSGALAERRARYATYRIDQLAHLVSLMDPSSLAALVEEVLSGERFEFGARDRLQFALLVVQRLEALLPLPPLDVFLRDLDEHPVEHERYRHQLYEGPELP